MKKTILLTLLISTLFSCKKEEVNTKQLPKKATYEVFISNDKNKSYLLRYGTNWGDTISMQNNNSHFPSGYKASVVLQQNPFLMWIDVFITVEDNITPEEYPIITINFYVDDKLVKTVNKQTNEPNQFAKLNYVIQ